MICIAAKTGGLPAVVARTRQNRSPAAELADVLIADRRLGQHIGQRRGPVLRMPPRPRKPAHVDHLLYSGSTQQLEEDLDRMRRVTNREDKRHCRPLWDDDELGSGALRLAAPRVGDGVEGHLLHLEPNLAGDRMAHESPVVLRELVARDGEARVAKDGEALESHRRRGKLGGRACRLAEIDDRGAGRRGLDRGSSRFAPQRVEDIARALAAERLFDGCHEIFVLVQAEDRIGAVLRGPLEPRSTTTGRDDPGGTEQPGGLHGDEAD